MVRRTKEYNKETYKTRVAWLKNRGIGGSSAAAVIGASKYQTALDVYNNIKSPSTEQKPNQRMIVGTKAEEHIRKLFELEHPEFKVIAPPRYHHWLFRRIDYPLLTVTPDGLLRLDNLLYGLEIKHVEVRNRKTRENWENNILPPEYFYQCLHYMVVMNDLRGVFLHVRLNYFKPEEDGSDKWVFDYAVDKTISVMREDFEQEILDLRRTEINFIENYVYANKIPETIKSF